MLKGWRFKFREAEQAFRDGRLDEADQLLRRHELRDYLPARRLCVKVAGDIAKRGRRRVIGGESSAGWRDLQSASDLAGETQDVISVREEMVRFAIREAENYMAAGENAKAIERLDLLERRNVANETARRLRDVAKRLESARHLRMRGKFVDAEAQLATATALRPDLDTLVSQAQQCTADHQRYRKLARKLHVAMGGDDWANVVLLADKMMEIAPEAKIPCDAKRQAWEKVGAKTSERRCRVTQTWVPSSARRPPRSMVGRQRAKVNDSRFLLWVDGVGGYLVCMSNEVILGQATPADLVDVAILGEVSRKHAAIRRDDRYLIEPFGRTLVNGQAISERTLLNHDDEIQLGESVRLRFRQPHALSTTARLDFVTRHRTQPSADGILLMSDSLVMGNKSQNHVVCREWPTDIVLYHQNGCLQCRTMGALEIDGKLQDGGGPLGRSSHVRGDDLSLSLEPIEAALAVN